MKEYKLAIIGFGNVGQGFTQILKEHAEPVAKSYGVTYKIVAISDKLKGSIYNPAGFSAQALLDAVQKEETLNHLPAVERGWDAFKTIKDAGADVIVETSYTDLKTGQPAIAHVEAALNAGKHVVTSNKGPAALQYANLKTLAQRNGVKFRVEGTVMSGTPAIFLAQEYLATAGIRRIQGILNGTTNFILTKMAGGMPYSSALEEAQELGYAEADPTGDVEGFDAAGKVVILANLLMGASIGMQDVVRQGITALTLEDIRSAAASGECWKLIGMVEKTADGKVEASVRPRRLPQSHPLASVSGATNAITYTTDIMGDISLIGAGAGRLETGYAILADLLGIHKELSK